MQPDPEQLRPISILHAETINALDDVSRQRYLEMLEAVPEPDWEDVCVRLLTCLKSLRDRMAAESNDSVMRVPAIARLIDRILEDPQMAGNAFRFMEHTKRSMDIIMLEQLMTLGDDA